MFLANGVYVFSVLVCHNQKMPCDCYLSMLDVHMGNARNKRCIVKRNKEKLRKGNQQDLIGKKQQSHGMAVDVTTFFFFLLPIYQYRSSI